MGNNIIKHHDNSVVIINMFLHSNVSKVEKLDSVSSFFASPIQSKFADEEI